MTMSQAGEPNEHPCAECSIHRLSVCAALDKADLRELAHLSRHIDFAAGETVFSQEEMTTSFYNLLEGVIRLYKLLPDGRRQIIGFALPGDFLGLSASVRHNFSADAIGPVDLAFLAAHPTRQPKGDAGDAKEPRS
jgi:CRP/FNR family transcriptional regulator, anaerobic regulatory protein